MNDNWSNFFGSPTMGSTFSSNQYKNKMKNINRTDRIAIVTCAHCYDSNNDITNTMQQRLLWDHQIQCMYPTTKPKIIKTLKQQIPKHDINARAVFYNVVSDEIVKPTSSNTTVVPYDEWKRNHPATASTHLRLIEKRKAKMIQVIQENPEIIRFIQNNNNCLSNIHIDISDIIPNIQVDNDSSSDSVNYSNGYSNSDDNSDNIGTSYSYSSKRNNTKENETKSDSQDETEKKKDENKQSNSRIKSGKKEIDDSSTEEETDIDDDNSDKNINAISNINDINISINNRASISTNQVDDSTTTLTNTNHHLYLFGIYVLFMFVSYL